jgi:hypothetical protein
LGLLLALVLVEGAEVIVRELPLALALALPLDLELELEPDLVAVAVEPPQVAPSWQME